MLLSAPSPKRKSSCNNRFFFFFFFKLHHAAFEILVPQPGLNPGTRAVLVPCPNHSTTRELTFFFLLLLNYSHPSGQHLIVVWMCILLMMFNIFHVLVGHLCIFFEEIYIQILCPLLSGHFVKLSFSPAP